MKAYNTITRQEFDRHVSPLRKARDAELAKPKRKPKTGKGAQMPNKTEAEFFRFLVLRGDKDVRYQALTFHMRNGCDYTADWVVFEGGVPVRAYEVKGSYRHHSYARARLAFNQCSLEFSGIEFIWVKKTKEGWIQE